MQQPVRPQAQQVSARRAAGLVRRGRAARQLREGGQGEEVVVGTRQVRRRDEGQSAAAALHRQLAVLGPALRAAVARCGDPPPLLAATVEVTEAHTQPALALTARVRGKPHPGEGLGRGVGRSGADLIRLDSAAAALGGGSRCAARRSLKCVSSRMTL